MTEPPDDDLKRRLLIFLEREELKEKTKSNRELIVWTIAASTSVALFAMFSPNVLRILAPHTQASTAFAFGIVGTGLAVATALLFVFDYAPEVVNTVFELLCPPAFAVCLVVCSAACVEDPVAFVICPVLVTIAFLTYVSVLVDRNASSKYQGFFVWLRGTFGRARPFKARLNALGQGFNWFYDRLWRLCGGIIGVLAFMIATLYVEGKSLPDKSAFGWWLVASALWPVFFGILVLVARLVRKPLTS